MVTHNTTDQVRGCGALLILPRHRWQDLAGQFCTKSLVESAEITVTSSNKVSHPPFPLDPQDKLLARVLASIQLGRELALLTACLWYLIFRFTSVVLTPATLTSQPLL